MRPGPARAYFKKLAGFFTMRLAHLPSPLRPIALLAGALILVSVHDSAHANETETCTTGLEAAKKRDHATAFVALGLCLESKPTTKVQDRASVALARVRNALKKGPFSEVSLAIEPSDARVSLEAIAIAIPGHRDIYLPLGKHQLRIEREGYATEEVQIEINRGAGAMVVLTLKKSTGQTSPGVADIDFQDEPPPALPSSRPQTASEFDSLMPEAYAKGKPSSEYNEARSPRWPWAIVATGLAIGVGGIVSHASGREGLAVGLYLGGAAVVAGGGTALALTRHRKTIPPDPELKLSVAYAWQF